MLGLNAFINWHFRLTCELRLTVSEFLNGWKSVHQANMGMWCCMSGLDSVCEARYVACPLLRKMEVNDCYPMGS